MNKIASSLIAAAILAAPIASIAADRTTAMRDDTTAYGGPRIRMSEDYIYRCSQLTGNERLSCMNIAGIHGFDRGSDVQWLHAQAQLMQRQNAAITPTYPAASTTPPERSVALPPEGRCDNLIGDARIACLSGRTN